MATSTYGTPYVQGSDLVSAYPTVSSSLATRVDEVSYKGNGLNAQTGTTYTLVAGDAGKTITLSNASPVAVTLPQDSTADLPDGAVVTFYNLGAGTVTISQGTGATLQGGSIALSQYQVTSVIKLSANTYGGFDAGGSPTIGSVVSTTKTDTFSMTSATFAAVTGLSASITPTSATNQVFVMVNIGVLDSSAWNQQFIRLMRGATAIGVGAAAGTRIQTSIHSRFSGGGATAYGPVSFAFLDSPATTSATTYSVEVATVQTATLYINRNSSDTDSTSNGRAASTITLMEVLP